jgi:signal transduction histidine kinase
MRPPNTGRSLFHNLAWGIVIGMLVIHVIGTGWYGHERMLDRAVTFAHSTIDRALVYRDLDETTRATLGRFSGEDFRTRISPVREDVPGDPWRHNSEVQDSVGAALGMENSTTATNTVVEYYHEGRQGWLRLSIPTYDGRWLLVDVRTDATRFGAIGIWTSTLTLLIIVAVLLLTRRLTRYLGSFARAAEGIGRSGAFEPLPENRGPREVRRASHAFNTMQERVQSLIDQRTQMLAAVSHDLRTIATRLQLRIEQIPDEVVRVKAESDLDAMTVILDESLAFARDLSTTEPMAVLDLRSLLQAVVDDAVDVGGNAELVAQLPVRIRGQAVALRRAFVNLIDNAVRYGQSARVTLATDGVIEIRDQGPGIAPEDVERALSPFVRLEGSRNRDTGGTGLGLAIANNVILRHGGTLRFTQTPAGFVVQVSLAPAIA